MNTPMKEAIPEECLRSSCVLKSYVYTQYMDLKLRIEIN